ncbi:hypothetical protein P168DRAFT_31757 [Aspergillus campestris IBT 28561]|uniref:Uncharacterized protein n=1 Tax=Aspergillus campestris (strain IBT 28561) TaxID=1392248 RepID=A0A2I1DGY5_ASPC2|nr:uncharacterized protein P168DRAFT_31757 [Aspergillus campestris IBT 28561]PKY09137.1 hypothetical protein P168DRAFT_31757 [Aspergillus campestris IBT 28561]
MDGLIFQDIHPHMHTYVRTYRHTYIHTYIGTCSVLRTLCTSESRVCGWYFSLIIVIFILRRSCLLLIDFIFLSFVPCFLFFFFFFSPLGIVFSLRDKRCMGLGFFDGSVDLSILIIFTVLNGIFCRWYW